MTFPESAPAAAAFSPKWTADKMGTSRPLAAAPLPSQQMPLAKEKHRGGRVGSDQPAVAAALVDENCVLRAAVSSLRGMITHERMLKTDVELQLAA
jgi:hypothetical protein